MLFLLVQKTFSKVNNNYLLTESEVTNLCRIDRAECHVTLTKSDMALS